MVCLGDGSGEACPKEWAELMRDCLARYFPGEVTLNQPFAGGYITRCHGAEMPWLQLELSRTTELDDADKRRRVRQALGEWVARADHGLRASWARR
jgi:N-formylglutamate amidohydrolase